MKKNFLLLFTSLALLGNVYGSDKNIDKIKNYNAPEWLKRVDFSMQFQDRHAKPVWTLETIQPLYQTEDSCRHTYFMQGRIAHRSDQETFNVGLGYRYLVPSERLLLGVNAFYDLTGDTGHKRKGIGAEAFGKQLTARFNIYNAITGNKVIEDVDGIKTYQRALSGWDAEAELPLPYMPWARIATQYYRWNSKLAKGVEGHKVSLLMNVTNNISLETGSRSDNYYSDNYIKCDIRLGAPECIESVMFGNVKHEKAFPVRNLKLLTLEKVRRHHDIVVEESRAGSAGIVFSGSKTK